MGYNLGFVPGDNLEYLLGIHLGSNRGTISEASVDQSEVSLQHSHRSMPTKSWPSARELLSRGATGPAVRWNAGQPCQQVSQPSHSLNRGRTGSPTRLVLGYIAEGFRAVDEYPSQMSGPGLGRDLTQGLREVETSPGWLLPRRQPTCRPSACLPRWERRCSNFGFYFRNMSVTQCWTLKMHLSSVSPSTAHRNSGLFPLSCSSCFSRRMGPLLPALSLSLH